MLGNSDIPLFQRFVAATTIVPRTFGAEAVVTDTVAATTDSTVAAAGDQQRRSLQYTQGNAEVTISMQ